MPELFKVKEECCGCSACQAVCPTAAISLEADPEGFYYPVIAPERCSGCGKCRQVCFLQTAER